MRAAVYCHTTSQSYQVELPGDAAGVAAFWRRTIPLDCPHCGATHLEGFRQLYVSAVLRASSWGEMPDARRTPAVRALRDESER